MLTILRSLFNNGDNDGNIIIKPTRSNDKIIKCHDYVLKNTSDFLTECIKNESFNNVINLDSHYETALIVFNFLYSEYTLDLDLNCNQIIELYYLINQLKCHDSIMVLKNHYLVKFVNKLDESNWFSSLKNIYGVSKYHDLQEEILKYFRNSVLTNIENFNTIYLVDLFKEATHEIKNTLFSICLETVLSLNNEIIHRNKLNDQKIKDKQKLNNYLKYELNVDNDEIDNSDDENVNSSDELIIKKKENVNKLSNKKNIQNIQNKKEVK